ncbi:hypothetical protein VULLAG_LOCUS2036 [Vulpes lagopus]
MAGAAEGESDHGDVQGQQDAPPPVYLDGERRRRGAGARLRPPAGPTPRPGQALQGTQPSSLPVQRGKRRWGRGARKQGVPRRPGRRLGSPGQPAERDPRPLRRRPDPGPSTLGPSAARAWPEQVPGPPGPPDPARPRSSPRRPPTRRPAGLTRRGGARPAAPRGSRTAAEGCPRPRRPRRPHARRPPPPTGAPHLPRAPRSHRPPAAPPPPPPPPPAPGPSPPLRLPPQPAPPAPGSGSRTRPLGASASGQARTGAVALWDWPVAGPPGPGSRLGRASEPRRGHVGERRPRSGLREGAAAAAAAAAALRPKASSPPSRRRPLLAGGGLRSGARPGCPREESGAQDPRPATAGGGVCLRPPRPSSSLPRPLIPQRFGHLPLTRAAPGGTAEGRKVQW